MNNSGIKPVGRAILVKPYIPELKRGLIEIPEQVQQRQFQLDQRAVIVDIGPIAWADESKPRAEVGDKVLVAKYAGALAVGPLDNEQYRLVNDRDIFAVITGE